MSKNARELLDKYAKGKCTPDEKAIVESWYLEANDAADDSDLPAPGYGKADRKLRKELQISGRRAWRPIPLAAACAFAAIVCLGYYALKEKDKRDGREPQQTSILPPGGNHAVLVLQNGRRIILDDKSDTRISVLPGLTAHKTSGGQIIFSQSPAYAAAADEGYNTIETPAGGQYQVVLSDGTKVWLNAGSSLRFPAAFNGSSRRVELRGEGYFEVANNAKKPFFVTAGTQQLEVLGTRFNIHNYSDEQQSRITLLGGSIKVTPEKKPAILLTPGEEVSVKDGLPQVRSVDAEDAIAWQKGYFDFNGKTLEEALKEVSRWYNVSVHYNNNDMRERRVAGTISRYETASQVLDKMALTGIFGFRIEGRTIEVN